MTRRLAILLVLPVLLLVGCTPTAPVAISSTPPASTTPGQVGTPTPSPSVVATPTATPTPTVAAIVAADYLINGHPHHPNSSGTWYGEYAFFTDNSKTVWCEFTIFSSDAPGAYCFAVPSAKGLVTYTHPAGSSNNCNMSSANARDGYALSFGSNPIEPHLAGWAGCATNYFEPPADLAKTKVLPNGATLTVKPFSCTVISGVARCTQKDSATIYGEITFGLHTASFITHP
jgi:hypothetical protein